MLWSTLHSYLSGLYVFDSLNDRGSLGRAMSLTFFHDRVPLARNTDAVHNRRSRLTVIQVESVSTGAVHCRGWYGCLHLHFTVLLTTAADRLVGLVVKASASRAEDPDFEPRWRRDFSGSSHTSDLNTGTPVATLPGAWRYRVSAGTGRPGVSMLWLGEVESLICSFYLSVAACTIVRADPSLRYTSLLLGR